MKSKRGGGNMNNNNNMNMGLNNIEYLSHHFLRKLERSSLFSFCSASLESEEEEEEVFVFSSLFSSHTALK